MLEATSLPCLFNVLAVHFVLLLSETSHTQLAPTELQHPQLGQGRGRDIEQTLTATIPVVTRHDITSDDVIVVSPGGADRFCHGTVRSSEAQLAAPVRRLLHGKFNTDNQRSTTALPPKDAFNSSTSSDEDSGGDVMHLFAHHSMLEQHLQPVLTDILIDKRVGVTVETPPLVRHGKKARPMAPRLRLLHWRKSLYFIG